MKIPSWLLYVILGIAVFVPLFVVIWVGVKGKVNGGTFQLELLKTSLNLLLLGVIGMLLKELLLAHSKRKIQEERQAQIALQKEEEERTRKIEALNRLTEGYWGIKKALHIIMAHKSAKSYKEQMHLIIDHRLDLQQLNNEVRGEVYGFHSKNEISGELKKLDVQINLLVDEWTEKHLELSWQQEIDEDSPPEKKKVPKRIESLPQLKSVWDDIDIVHMPYQRAADLIRKELLENTQPPRSEKVGSQLSQTPEGLREKDAVAPPR